MQEHRRDELGALQLGVAFLQVGLVFVGGEQFRVGEVAVVADQREAAVGGGVVSDLLLVDGVGDAVVGAGAAAVAGVGAGSAAFVLPEPLLDPLVDTDADQRAAPAWSIAAVAACSTATVVFIRVLGAASRWLSWSRAAMPRAMRSARAWAS